MDEINKAAKIVNVYSSLIFKAGLLIVLAASLFLFTNTFTEMYDMPKLLILFIFTALLLVFLAVRFTVNGKVLLIRTPLDLPLLIIAVVAIVGTFLSPAPYVSLFGNSLRVHGSLISIIIYVLFYFILINNLKSVREIKRLLMLFIFGTQILAAGALIVYTGAKVLPDPWTHGFNFTPTGSSFSTTAILVLVLPFIVMRLLNDSKLRSIILNAVFLTLSALTIALTGTWPIWIAGAAVIVLTLGIGKAGALKSKPLNLAGLVVPLALTALITGLSFVPPVGGAQNPLYSRSQNFPREIQLPFVTSWKVAASAFRDSPFWGTGPSTFLFDFTSYKPAEFNTSKFWSLRFDTAFNEYLNILATAGGIGILGLLSLTAVFISAALKAIRSRATEEGGNNIFKHALALAGIGFFIILALHPATLPLWIAGTVILAAFMVITLEENAGFIRERSGSDVKNVFMRIAANVTGSDTSSEIRVDALPGILLVAILALVIAGGFFGSKIVLADYHHRLALNAVAQNQGIVAYNELIAAEKLNPYSDLYRTDLAQTNFALANAIAAAKAPSEASPAGSLTDQDKQNIQVLLSQSVAEARTAVTLSPKSAVNWEILAVLYRQIAGVAQNALLFSLDSYGRAIFQDPLNPNLRLNVGGVYYAVQNYDMAIRFFTDAINLKPDFANGYFNMSVALRDKGDLQGAQVTAEKTLSLIDASSPDYQPLSDYIEDLKKKIAGDQGQSEIEPPASKTSGSLQEEKLPKVVNLPKPDKIATPEAVKKPAATPTPQPEPTQEP